MTDIARLTVVLEAQSARYEKKIEQIHGQLKRFERNQRQTLDKVDRGFDAATAGTRNLRQALIGLASAATVRGIVNAGIQAERFGRAFATATGSVAAGQREFQFVRDVSNRLGLSLQETAESYSKLTAAARGTALAGQGARDIFVGISSAATVLGLNADQTQGALTAIEQIISKGKVSAEELRGQLGERLPGAFQIAARAIGVTTSELDDMLKKGELTAEALLPKLAEELQKTFGPQVADAATSAQAAINRLNTAIFDLKVAIANSGVLDAVGQFAGGLATLLSGESGFGSKSDALEGAIERLKKERNLLTQQLERTTDANLRQSLGEALDRVSEQLEKVKRQQIDILTGASGVDRGSPSKSILGVAAASAELDKFFAKQKQDLEKLRHQFVNQFETAEQEVARVLADFDMVKHLFPPEEQARIIEAIKAPLTEGLEEIRIDAKMRQTAKKGFDELQEMAKQAARNMQDAFADFLFDPFQDGVKGMIKAFFDAIRRMLANQAALEVFKFLKGLGKSGKLEEIDISSLPKPRALGGPVSAGSPYIVGERGPELFVPGLSGTILPSLQGAGGVSVSHNIVVNGADPARTAELLAPILARSREQTKADILELRAKGRL